MMSYHHDQLQRLRCHRFEGCNWTHQFYKKGSERINFFAYPIALNYFGTLFASIWLIYLSQGVWNLSIQNLYEAPANSWKHRNWGTCAINQFTVKGFDHFFQEILINSIKVFMRTICLTCIKVINPCLFWDY